jgi:arylsulfatase A-like enzyme
LEKSKLLDDTLIIITADHGEEFWEHAKTEAKHFYDTRKGTGYGHGHNVFREITEVPATFYGFRGLKKQNPISSADIVPTILTELGITPKFRLDGKPLQEKQPSKRVLLTEASGYGYEKKALVIGDIKFLYAPDDGVRWVFNLERDPDEMRPITDDEVTSIMEHRLKKIISRMQVENLKKPGEGQKC